MASNLTGLINNAEMKAADGHIYLLPLVAALR